MKRIVLSFLLFSAFSMVGAGFSSGPGAAAVSKVDLLINKLVEKQILTRVEAEAILTEVEVADQKDFKDNLVSHASWLEGLKSKGDVRLRYEAFSREDEDSSDRNRFRIRARWGLEKKFNDEWKAGFRIATGGGTDEATSTNQTLDGEFSLKDIFIDRAYGIYTPTKHFHEWIPAINKVEIGAGKVANPFKNKVWNTTIIWDTDVNPEGIYETVDFRLATPSKDAKWDLHTLMGQFVVDEDSDLSPGDHELFAYGIGTTYQWAKNHKASFKATFYDWQDYATFLKSGTGLASSLGGNDREVDKFQILNFYGDVDFVVPTWWGDKKVKVYGDYAHNLGLQSGGSTDESTVDPALRADSDDAFSTGVVFGKAKRSGEWSFNYEYLYIEPNAVVGNFSESDLGVGGANNKGHKLSYKYKIHKNIDLKFTTWLVERVDKTILTYGSGTPTGDDDEVLRTQLDLVYKF